jgi:acyl carrier protein
MAEANVDASVQTNAEAMWPEAFELVLRPLIPLLPADAPLAPDLELQRAGLDSLATVNLLIELEDTFNITFPDDMLKASTVSTPANLWAALDALIAQSGNVSSRG